MKIRPAQAHEYETVMQIYADARRYMREHGNPDQWGEDYPPANLIRSDIARGCCHVCEEGGELLGVFYYCMEDDPTYRTIYEGEWLNNRPYGVLHRIAVAKHGRGVAAACFDFCFAQCKNLKIDTHRQNLPMQHVLAKNGFTRCGLICLENGDERIAYQRAGDAGCGMQNAECRMQNAKCRMQNEE